MNSTFQHVGGLTPRRSVFNLSYDKKFTCDMGQLIPVMCDEVVPGDIFNISNEIVIRFQPLVAPMLQEVSVATHYFFVPYRLLWDEWEDYITGGSDGQNASILPRINRFSTSGQVSNSSPGVFLGGQASLNTGLNSTETKGTLWDYFGFPIDTLPAQGSAQTSLLWNDENTILPMSFPFDSYALIWNEYYRDENLQGETILTAVDRPTLSNGTLGYNYTPLSVMNVAWTKDYFTSALPWQQKGVAPAIPITASGSTNFNGFFVEYDPSPNTSNPSYYNLGISSFNAPFRSLASGVNVTINSKLNDTLNTNTTNVVSAGFDVSQLRLATQVQKWLERNARAGSRYTEFLNAHFGVSPADSRLQRPEFIGGTRNPVIVSEVLQTSATGTDSPQGNQAGHAITVGSNRVGSYRVTEYGLIMGLMFVKPKAGYQQGINRQWLRRSRYDFYFPEFAHLSEQGVYNEELYCDFGASTSNTDVDIFGYQGRYNELRYKPTIVAGDMRDTLSYWHLGRIFSARPNLNNAFIRCVPRKDVFAVQDEPCMIVNYGNRIFARRPMPVIPEPGLLDHF